jgi:hypothetical protein
MNKDIIPLIIAIVLMIGSIITTFLTDYILNVQQYIGFVLIVLSTIIYFKRKELYFHIFGTTLIMGTLGLTDFFVMTFGIRIGIFQINPLILIILIIFLIQNKNRILPSNDSQRNDEPDNNRIDTFREKFKNKSEHELTQIMDSNSPYVEEARIAAKSILKEKNVL